MAVSAIDATGVNEFHRELINRFFNPKSYFLFSFITELKKREALLENPENVAAIGLLVDEIIGSENKFGKILDLTRIPGFDFFYHTLLEKVEYLRVAHLTTQQMMETVKSLGINLAETFNRIMSEHASRDALLKYVGIELETTSIQQPSETLPEAKSEPQSVAEESSPAPAEKGIDLSKLDNLFAGEKPGNQAPDPWDFFYEDVNGKLNQIDALLEKFEASSHNRALLSEIKANFQELREWAMIQGNEGIETIAMRLLIALNLALRTFSYPLGEIIPHVREAIKALREVNKFGWAGENLDIIPVVIRRLESLYSEIKHTSHPPEATPPAVNESFSEPAARVETESPQAEAPLFEPESTEQPVEKMGKEETSVEKEIFPESVETEPPVLDEEESSIQEETENSLSESIPEEPVSEAPATEVQEEAVEEEPAAKEEFEEILLESDLDLEELQEEPAAAPEKEPEESTLAQEKPEAPVEDVSEDELDETVSEMERLYQEMFPEEFEEDEAPSANPPKIESESQAPAAENSEKSGETDLILEDAVDESLLTSELGEPEPPGETEDELQLPGEEDDDLRKIIEEISAEESFQPAEPESEKAPMSVDVKDEAVSNPNTSVEGPKSAPEPPQKFLEHGGRDFVEEADMYFQFTQKAFASLERNPGLHRAFEDIELACYSLKILARKLGYIYVAKITEKIEEIFKSVLSGELLLKPEQIAYLSGVVVALKKRGMENRLSDDKISGWAAEVLEKIAQIKASIPVVEKQVETKKSEPEAAEEDPLEFLMYEDTGKYFKQLLDD